MTQFVTVHRAPGLSRDEFQGNAAAALEGVHATFNEMWVDIFSGFIVSLYEAEDQAALEREFERLGFRGMKSMPSRFTSTRPRSRT